MSRRFTVCFPVETDLGKTRVVEVDHLAEGDGRALRNALVAGGFNAFLICTETVEVIVE